MKILISGVTGFIGHKLAQQLTRDGHTVCGFSRNAASARERVPELAEAFAWQPTTQSPPSEAFAGVDTVVHLLGETVVGRWTDEKKRAIRESRVTSTRRLVDAIAALPEGARPRALVSASAIGAYGDSGDERLDESAPVADDFLGSVSKEWEGEAYRAESAGVRVCTPRIGIVLGVDGGALKPMLLSAKFGVVPVFGSGRQWWSWIHREDLVAMLAAMALDDNWRGVYNATAPQPETQRTFSRTLAKVKGRFLTPPVPAALLRVGMGEMSVELLSSKRVVPERALTQGFQFKFTELHAALGDLVQ